MPADYTITSVDVRPEYTTPNGTFVPYVLGLQGAEGALTAELHQKPQTPAPQVGQTIYGHTEQKGTTLRFKKDQRDGGFSGGGGGDGFQRKTDPEAAARMGRAHAQKVAIDYALFQQQRGKLPDTFTTEHLKELINWFESDVAAAGERAGKKA